MKETLRNSVVAVVLGVGASVGFRAAENPVAHAANILPEIPKNHLVIDRQNLDQKSELNEDLRNVFATFLVTTEIVGVTLFGYKMSDGARGKTELPIRRKPKKRGEEPKPTEIKWEEWGWKYGIPAGNFIAASGLLTLMWLEKL